MLKLKRNVKMSTVTGGPSTILSGQAGLFSHQILTRMTPQLTSVSVAIYPGVTPANLAVIYILQNISRPDIDTK